VPGIRNVSEHLWREERNIQAIATSCCLTAAALPTPHPSNTSKLRTNATLPNISQSKFTNFQDLNHLTSNATHNSTPYDTQHHTPRKIPVPMDLLMPHSNAVPCNATLQRCPLQLPHRFMHAAQHVRRPTNNLHAIFCSCNLEHHTHLCGVHGRWPAPPQWGSTKGP
jgi:hypothetical protein